MRVSTRTKTKAQHIRNPADPKHNLAPDAPRKYTAHVHPNGMSHGASHINNA